jgi:hypothetical protein
LSSHFVIISKNIFRSFHTDFGGGAVTVTGGVVSTSATHPAGIYFTGNITVTGATINAIGDNGSVMQLRELLKFYY